MITNNFEKNLIKLNLIIISNEAKSNLKNEIDLLSELLWAEIDENINKKIIPINQLINFAIISKKNLTGFNLEKWTALKDKIPEQFRVNPSSYNYLYLSLAFNYIFLDKVEAFHIFIVDLLKICPFIERLDLKAENKKLYLLGFFDDSFADSIQAAQLSRIIIIEKETITTKLNLFIQLFGNRSNTKFFLDRVFSVLELVTNSLNKFFLDDCLANFTLIESWIFGVYIKSEESREKNKIIFYKATLLMSIFKKIIIENFDKIHELNSFSDFKKIKNGLMPVKKIPNVAFIVHTGYMLAHIVNLFTFLTGLNNIEARIKPYIIIISSSVEVAFKDQLKELKIPYTRLNHDRKLYATLLTTLLNLNIDICIFVSTIPSLFFMSIFNNKLIKVIWWSMKYDYPLLEKEIWRMKLGSLDLNMYKNIDGNIWRNCSVPLNTIDCNDFTEDEKKSIDILQEKFKSNTNTTVLGVMGRAAKMLNPEYINTIKCILDLEENAIFIYSCEPDLEMKVSDMIKKYGQSEKMFSIGWLKNTKTVLKIIDIYLDTFPFASGHSGYEFIVAGKPIVVLITEESLMSSTATDLYPHIKKIENYELDSPYVLNLKDYINISIKMIKDKDMRNKVGKQLKELLLKINPSIENSAKQIESHIIQIYNEVSPP